MSRYHRRWGGLFGSHAPRLLPSRHLAALAIAAAVGTFGGTTDVAGESSPDTVPAPPDVPQVTHLARITEELRTIPTYPFSEPNPVPILTRDRRLYPYHSFEGYSATAQPREWKVVKLENDWIEVLVLPEVGGKIWGAVVKATGHEFIYRNEVLKFRNIALRGPWTSGGIEFNFGVIGHAPSTATPVDYTLAENPDGSVSCWVGSMDLPSRTHWRVEIRLPPDRATFETNVFWYNPTPLDQPYYSWMTAAAFARNDLEMTMPGDAYLQHSGDALDWPIDGEGRYLPLYRNNTFDGHKSYHVVGEVHDFFGGYYHDEDYGFGHWARYEDMPGQKLWLWALSREGGVWEDLLTDTDGQYVEFQAGRLFVQYSAGSAVNPITQAVFDPLSSSRWTETWFPLEGLGGLTDASRDAATHVAVAGSRLTVGINAFRDATDTLTVWLGNAPEAPAARIPVALQALEPFETTLEIDSGVPFRVQLPALGLDYASDSSTRRLSRPFATDAEAWRSIPEVDQVVFQAREFVKGRQYARARAFFQAALEKEPWSRGALLGMAELSLRSGLYEDGLEQANRVLQLDAYDPRANFLAGTLYRALGQAGGAGRRQMEVRSPAFQGGRESETPTRSPDTRATDVGSTDTWSSDARDAFGWAARAVGYRSASYVQLAQIALAEQNFPEAEHYAGLALDYDRGNVPALQVTAILNRATGRREEAEAPLDQLLELDPLHHFVWAERYLAAPDQASAQVFLASLGGELPDQTILELAIGYVNLGRPQEAAALLRLVLEDGRFSPNLMIQAWLAWLTDDPSLLADPGTPDLVFPYRTESLPVLRWAAGSDISWVWRYLLALNLWAVDRDDEAGNRMMELGEEPDFGPAYAARGLLREQSRGMNPELDLRRAVSSDPDLRVLHLHLIRHLQSYGQWEEALEALDQARSRFPTDFELDLLQARALLNLGRALEAAEVLASTRVLPSENARESHHLYQEAHILAALDAVDEHYNAVAKEHLRVALEWPESLGQGRPYDPEERLVRFLLGRVEERLGNRDAARQAYEEVVAATRRKTGASSGEVLGRPSSGLDLLVLPSLGALGRGAEVEAINRRWQAELERLFRGLTVDMEGHMILRALELEN